jgi:hypothetical protein
MGEKVMSAKPSVASVVAALFLSGLLGTAMAATAGNGPGVGSEAAGRAGGSTSVGDDDVIWGAVRG